ncbi:RedY protein [Streptomyces sp. MAR4 CNX-425]|uniref:RedY protein n=1 Tax=Streptomyces sp. MAR4 CNX-425 TaxID=3406343 RepID=UPI003B5116A1
MDLIVHRIRLHAGVPSARFENWVRDTDYRTCPALPSVVAFTVQRVSADPDAPVHYFEVITVTGRAAFEADMATDAFRRLAADFGTMASVVDELGGERIEPGYAAAGAAAPR